MNHFQREPLLAALVIVAAFSGVGAVCASE